MTPDDHYKAAESALREHGEYLAELGATALAADALALGAVHATLALAGYTRSARAGVESTTAPWNRPLPAAGQRD